jgi:hypothetical protein
MVAYFQDSPSTISIVALSILTPILHLPNPGHQFSNPLVSFTAPSPLPSSSLSSSVGAPSPIKLPFLLAISCFKSHHPKLAFFAYSRGKTLHHLSVPASSPCLLLPLGRGGCTMWRSIPTYAESDVVSGKYGRYEIGL